MKKRGPYKYSQEQHDKAVSLRKENHGYQSIAAMLGVPWATVRWWVRDIHVEQGAALKKAVALWPQRPLRELKSKQSVRLRLISLRGHRCQKCDLTEWLGRPIALETEHIDGNKRNNAENNLLLLCPNCHATTPTWRRTKKSVWRNADAPALEAGGRKVMQVQPLPPTPI